jgi:hypothetical protein
MTDRHAHTRAYTFTDKHTHTHTHTRAQIKNEIHNNLEPGTAPALLLLQTILHKEKDRYIERQS